MRCYTASEERRPARLERQCRFWFLLVSILAVPAATRCGAETVAASASGLGRPTPVATATRPVVGYADLHVHQFIDDGLAGAWLYGEPTGPIETALARCSGNLPLASGRNHGALDWARVSALAGPLWGALFFYATESMGADTGLHSGRRHGYCQSVTTPGPGLCRGNAACNVLSQSSCTPTHVCEWKSVGTLCRDKAGDGISVGVACNLLGHSSCANTCYWDFPLCRGNAACNLVKKSKCKSNVCSLQSAGSICRDRDGDGKSVGAICNTLGPAACDDACSWDADWGSLTIHPEVRAHDWTRRRRNADKASWPAWDAIAHQQVHTGWLHQAYRDGLRLMVMSALNNEAFCLFLPLANRAPGYDCKDMANVIRQLDAAKALGSDPTTPWYRIAYSAAEARDIIRDDKLAVVLSVEASDIFNEPDPLATLQTLYDAGARTLQPMHQFNCKLGGVAWHEGAIKVVQMIKNLPNVNHLCKDDGGTGDFAKCDASVDHLNYKGLTMDGVRFVVKMMNLGMPIDIAHMSELGVKDVEVISAAACDYPLYVSHGHVRTLLAADSWKAEKKHEKTTPDWQLDLLHKTGGMFGLRTGADHHRADDYFSTMGTAGIQTMIPSKAEHVMPNGEPGGNEYHFAYALDYVYRLKGVHVALGSDLNGLIAQMVFDGEAMDTPLAGLAHVGKLPELLDKVRATGVDGATIAELESASAEAYLRMWERATDFAGGGACCPTPGVTGVVPPEAWFGRANRVSIVGDGFTPHQSMEVYVRRAPGFPLIPCADVQFVSGTSLRCTLPPLAADTSYEVWVRNGGCDLEGVAVGAYHASAIDTGPVVDPREIPFRQAELVTALADEVESNGWLEPNRTKIDAVDWQDPAWDETVDADFVPPIDRPLDDGYPQVDWEMARTDPDRPPIPPLLDVLLNKEDAAEMADPLTMVAACDLEEAEQDELAAASGWPANWRAQLSSLCDWQSNVCESATFRCPDGTMVEPVGQVSDASTATCPFDAEATAATCPGTGVPSPTPTATPDGTPTASLPCVGDCDGLGSVSINELITGVNIALGNLPLDRCPDFDANGDGRVSIGELIGAVRNALSGCAA